MVSKFAAIVLCVAVVRVAADDGYDRDHYGYRPDPESESRGYEDRNDRDDKGDFDEYGERRFHFHPAKPVVDPKYYLTVLDEFESCVAHKCTPLSQVTCSESVIQNLENIGKYSSCVTECSAWQFIRVMRNFKRIIGKLYESAAAKLTGVRKYLSDSEYYDILGNRTRIGESCCLPKDHFVSWDRLLLPVHLHYSSAPNGEHQGLISVETYLRVCTTDVKEGVLHYLQIHCKPEWVTYLEVLQRNIGHLVLAPKCKRAFPDGNCCETSVSNPRAESFPNDVCVATEIVKDRKAEKVHTAVIRQMNAASQCENDEIVEGTTKITIRFRRVSPHKIGYYTVTQGFPSSVEGTTCAYHQGLAVRDNSFYKRADLPPHVKHATLNCPATQTFEYCNPKQFVGYLENQLFDASQCDINEWATYDETKASSLYYPVANTLTLACQYRAISLKCDCMETVLNCYTREYQFTTSIGKVLGKASSIMIGFILCQQPKIFSMFGDFTAIDKAQIMRTVLMQAGAMVADNSSVPPASFAFLSFGLGMVAFVVVKAAVKNYRRRYVNTEDGYRNLI